MANVKKFATMIISKVKMQSRVAKESFEEKPAGETKPSRSRKKQREMTGTAHPAAKPKPQTKRLRKSRRPKSCRQTSRIRVGSGEKYRTETTCAGGPNGFRNRPLPKTRLPRHADHGPAGDMAAPITKRAARSSFGRINSASRSNRKTLRRWR